MHLRSNSFAPYARMHPSFAFGEHDATNHFRFAGNRNPHLEWSGVPDGVRSFALLCVDHDVPSVGDDVNREGRTVSVDLPRVKFYHWVLVDLPPALRSIEEGSHANGVHLRGKPVGPSPSGGLQGVNNFTDWFADNADLSGTYAGYDGCGPPWNDERLHGYRFQLFALDVPSLGLAGGFKGPDVEAAIEGHVLAQAELIGLYAINPDV